MPFYASCTSSNSSALPLFSNVVVVGNGPSAIMLALLLSGWHPFVKSDANLDSHPLLRMLKGHLPSNRSLLDIDFSSLFNDFDGDIPENINPVSYLFDLLFRPNADFDPEAPSFLEWRKIEPLQKLIVTVVGKSPIGGIWGWDSLVQEDMYKAVSYAKLLELPLYSFSQFINDYHLNSFYTDSSSYTRPSRWHVALYYKAYVEKMGLSLSFFNGITVSRIEHIGNKNLSNIHNPTTANFSLNIEKSPTSNTSIHTTKTIYAAYLILATGKLSSPKKLDIPGEDFQWVYHEQREFLKKVKKCDGLTPLSPPLPLNMERNLDISIPTCSISAFSPLKFPTIQTSSGEKKAETQLFHQRLQNVRIKPVLIVGTGRSAADALIYFHSHGIPTLHVFHSPYSFPFKQPLASSSRFVYPEYYEVFESMKAVGTGEDLTMSEDSIYGTLLHPVESNFQRPLKHLHSELYYPIPNGLVEEFICDNFSSTHAATIAFERNGTKLSLIFEISSAFILVGYEGGNETISTLARRSFSNGLGIIPQSEGEGYCDPYTFEWYEHSISTNQSSCVFVKKEKDWENTSNSKVKNQEFSDPCIYNAIINERIEGERIYLCGSLVGSTLARYVIGTAVGVVSSFICKGLS